MYGLLYLKCHSELWVQTGIEEPINCVVCGISQCKRTVHVFLCSECQSLLPDLLVYCRYSSITWRYFALKWQRLAVRAIKLVFRLLKEGSQTVEFL